jgi:mono/diheme cytochrome c family protein
MKKMLLTLGLLVSCAALAAPPPVTDKHAIDHGKFLVGYGGCNDCHTPGWAEHAGHAPRAMLLTGGAMNFQGPWGTTYAPNLRLYVQKLTVAQWIANLRALKTRPAMPYWTFRYLSDKDLASMYAYIHSLGPAGHPAHAWVPPGQSAPIPYFKLVLPPPPVRPAQH